MRLDNFRTFTDCPRWNYGDAASAAAAARTRLPVSLVIVCVTLLLSATAPARAEQANQTGFDPRQAEKHFVDDLRSEQSQRARPALRLPSLARPALQADSRPLFVLRGVSPAGASAIPQ